MTLVAIVFSVINGTLEFSIGDIVAILFGRCDNALAQQIITNVRLPRTLIALLVGVNMGVAGALLQSLLRNPLASPNIIGVNSGAGLAAVAIMTLLPSSINMVPPAAFVGAMLASLVIYMLSRRGGSSSVTTIVLAGVALSALLSSVTSAIMILFSDDLTITYTWMIGGLTGRGWSYFRLIWPYSLAGVTAAVLLSPQVNLLMLGDEVSKNLGLSIEVSRILVIITASILAGSAVSVAGTIGFLGLVAPHASRMLIGNDNRYLIVLSGLFGGLLLVVADTFARTLFSPLEIPVGIITAALGAPFFLFLLYQRRSSLPK
jgi:iron complex transport system permease protein